MNVSLNAQQYTPTPMAFFAAPSTAALSPTSGPLLGGTNITITAAALPLAFAEATQCAMGAYLREWRSDGAATEQEWRDARGGVSTDSASGRPATYLLGDHSSAALLDAATALCVAPTLERAGPNATVRPTLSTTLSPALSPTLALRLSLALTRTLTLTPTRCGTTSARHPRAARCWASPRWQRASCASAARR